jgi:hypothetical protein
MRNLLVAAALLLAPAQESKSHEIPFELNNHIILVKGEINGKADLTLIFDTGASETVITPETAKALGIKGTPAGNGMETGKADSLKLGGALVKNVMVVIWDPPQAQPLKQVGVDYAGILGYSFISEWLVTLDYKAKKILLTPHGAEPSKEATVLGAKLDGTKVVDVEKGSKAEKAGLKKDDDLYKVNGLSVDKAAEVAKIVEIAKTGDELRFGVNRGKEKKELKVSR